MDTELHWIEHWANASKQLIPVMLNVCYLNLLILFIKHCEEMYLGSVFLNSGYQVLLYAVSFVHWMYVTNYVHQILGRNVGNVPISNSTNV